MAITISGENNNDKIIASDGVIDSLSALNIAGIVTATTFVGNLTGNVTGNVTGDVGGNLTGNVTGNINNSTLLLQTGGYERVRIDSTGKVGINSTAPNTRLDVIESSASRTWTPGTSVVSMFERNGHTRVTLTSAASSYGEIDFGDSNDDNAGYIRYDHSDDSMSFRTATTEKLLISSGGHATISADSYSALTINTTNDGVNGPEIQLMHTSTSPAANDIVGQLRYSGKDSAGDTTLYSKIQTKATTVTNGSETGHLDFSTRGGGAYNSMFRLSARGTASAPSYTTDDMNGIILDTYNTGNPYPRYFNFIAKSAGDTDSNIGFWTEAVGGSPIEKLRITSDGKIGVNATTTALIAPTYTLDLGGNDGALDTSEQNTLRIRCNNGGTAIRVGSGGGGSRVTLLRVDGNSGSNNCFGETDASNFGASLVYHGDRSGNENSFAIYMDQASNASQIEAFNIRQNGDYMHSGSSYSDRDHKDNITAISGTALDKITQLSPKTWNWKPEYHDIPTDRIFAGFIAQEVQPHIPSIVRGTDGQGDMSLDYQGLLAWTIKALTELKSENDNLKARVNALEG